MRLSITGLGVLCALGVTFAAGPHATAAALLGAPSATPALAAGAGMRQAAPAPPTGLRVPPLAYDATSITLAWEKPASHADIADYDVYENGQFIGSANAANTSQAKHYIDEFYADPANSQQVRTVEDNFTATGLKPGTRYRFTVRSVDAAGIQSRDSLPVIAATTAMPKACDITGHGAVGDGSTVNTQAIQATIDSCPAGGEVVVPPGTFVTGAIWLKSDMTLDIAKGATLLGSANADDYPYHFRYYDYSNDQRFYGLINAHTYDYGSLSNIRIVGEGTIDGNGWKQAGTDSDGFPVSAPSSSSTVETNGILAKAQVDKATELNAVSPYGTRSPLIAARGVNDLYIGGVTEVNPSGHTMMMMHTTNVTVNDVKMETYNINNGDGIDFANSQRLTVINDVFDTGDDSMNFAAGLGAASKRDAPTAGAWISGNYFRHGHGAVALGSHTGAWIENIVAEDNVIDLANIGLRMKTDPANGGGGKNVLFRDNAIKDVAQQAFVFTSAYADPGAAIVVEPAPDAAQFRDITVDNVTVDGTGQQAIQVIGVLAKDHADLHFSNVRFIQAEPTDISYLKDSSFHNVVFDNTPNPWVIAHSTGLSFTGDTTTTAVTADAAAGPGWPAGSSLTTATSDTTATLSWPAAADNAAVASYDIVVDGSPKATVPGSVRSCQLTGLTPAHAYDIRVRATDATGNQADGPQARVTTTGTAETVPPVVPSGGDRVAVDPSSVGTTWAKVAWQAATDNYGVDHYDIYVNGERAATVPADTLSHVVGGLRPATGYVFAVRAVDGAGNATAYGTQPQATTADMYDASAPGWPASTRLTADSITRNSARLSWTPARDDIEVTGYRVYVNGVPVDHQVAFTPVNEASTTTGSSYTITGLTPGTTYTFTVQAGDEAGKWTGSGPSLRVTTRH
jgi:exo-poly-alpha-galacturonosidase